MDEIKPKNIFEAAGKAKKPASSSKVVPPVRPAVAKQVEPLPESITIKPDQLLNLHKDPEINLMLNKMARMQEDIRTKLDEIYNNSGVSFNQIKNFLDNPGNFPPDVWQKIQSQRDVLEKKIGDVLQSLAIKPKTGPMGMRGEGKERKSKTLGSRRNWIRM